MTSQAEQGIYTLPTIQREFVWTDRHIKAFITAMKKRYPLGMITLWMPKHTFIVDPVPFADDIPSMPNAFYVLDGQQRITTMLLIKNGFSIMRSGEAIERNIVFYDPFDDELVSRSQARYPDFEISLTDVVQQNKEYRRWVSDLESRGKKREKNRMEDFAQALREIQVGMRIVGPSYSYEDVALIFLAINSAGVTIKPIDMFFSLLASKFKKGFKDDILRFHRRTTKKTNLSIRTPIRCLAAATGLSQTSFTTRRMKSSITRLAQDPQRTKDEWLNVKTALTEAYKLLADRGIENLRMLPAEAVLTPFSFYVYMKKGRMSGKDSSLMFYWLLMASYHGRYSQTVNGRLDQDINALKSGKDAKGMVETLRKQVEGLKITEDDCRHPYSKKLLLLMFVTERDRQAMDWFGGGFVHSGSMHAHHIFPRKYLRESGIQDKEFVDCLGNITLISSKANLDISSKAPSEYFESEGVDKRKLEQHFVPLDESLWTADAFDEFLFEREKLLYKGIDSFLKRLSSK
jgi:hypothetical protein